jgi:hypothetical protein
MQQNISFIESLEKIQDLTKQSETVEVWKILKILSKRGIEALLILFSIPIPIPGISNLFGLILAFLGVQFAFGSKLWVPKWIAKREINSHHLSLFITKTINALNSLHTVIHPRLTFFIQNPFMSYLNALVICLLAFIVAMPIPIPLTNILFATPILAMALGLLNDDGLFVLIGYVIVVMDFFILLSLYRYFT